MAKRWTMAGALALAASVAWGLEGRWEGEWTVDGSTVAIVVRLEKTDGGWSGSLDVPPQAIEGLPLEELRVVGSEVAFTVPGLPGGPRFAGRLEIETDRLGEVVEAELAGTVEAEAVAPPATDIHLLRLEPGAEGPAGAVPVGRVTDRDGYDNQPAFLPGGEALLYTSQHGDQTDVYRYDLAAGTTSRVTATPESEYSPTPMPDGERFSVVRVEADGTQRLWAFPLAGGEPELLLPEVAPVGYHAWIDAETVALFILGEPITLQIASLPTGEARVVGENVGRSLHRTPWIPAVTYVDSSEPEAAELWTHEARGDGRTELGAMLPESQDYVWAAERRLLAGSGSVLYRGDVADEIAWHPIADLADAGIAGITRLAVSPDGTTLALVAERPASGEPARVIGTFELHLVERP